MNTVPLFAVVVVFMLLIWKQHMAKHQCSYCGCYRGHDVHCPWKIRDQFD